VFEAASTLGERGFGPQPVGYRPGSDRAHPVEQPGLAGQQRFVVVDVGGPGADQPGHRHLPVTVPEPGQHGAQHHQRIGGGAAEHARVQPGGQGGHLEGALDQPAQADGQRRVVHRPVVGVGDHDHVAGQALVVPLQEIGEGR
jgi:hypothetical protein